MREQLVARLLAGEALSSPEVKKEFNSSNDHLVSEAVKFLQKQGHTAVRERRQVSDPGVHPPISQVFWKVEAPPAISSNGDGEPLSVGKQIEATLVAGEWLSAREAAERFDCASSNFHFQLARMRKRGVRFKTEELEALGPKGKPTKYLRYAIAGEDEEANEPRSRRKGLTLADGESLEGLPDIGEEAMCYLKMIDDNGQLVMGWRNGNGRWIFTYSGTG